MYGRVLGLALFAGACGSVARDASDAAVGDGQGGGTPVTYKGTLDATMPAPFGGGTFCNYTITLKQLAVELGILPSKQAMTGRVQALNVEASVPPCTFLPAPPSIANYTLASSKPSAAGATLTFQGAAANTPAVDLVIELSGVGSAYQARLGFHRTDQQPPLDWSVLTTVPLSPQ